MKYLQKQRIITLPKSKCAICLNVYHLQCLSLNEVYQSYISNNQDSWYCAICLCSTFPFNCIEDENNFHQALNYRDHFELYWNSFCHKVFNPFDTYSQFDKSGLFDETDSDLDFYNDFYNYNKVVYNYFSIDQLNKTINFH